MTHCPAPSVHCPPSILLKRAGETGKEYRGRMKALVGVLSHPTKFELIRSRYKAGMKLVLRDYRKHLTSAFAAKKVREEIE